MKLLIIGGTGTIGRRVVHHFRLDHEVVIAGRESGDIQLDLTDAASIESAMDSIGMVDAICSIAGEAKWAPFSELSEDDYYVGIRSKMMGQVNVARIGVKHLNPGGSITLSTGILADDPVPMTASASMVNGAVNSFVQAAALEMTHDRRINVVSLGLVQDSAERYRDFFPGHNPISMEKATNAYVRSILGKTNGQIIRCYE